MDTDVNVPYFGVPPELRIEVGFGVYVYVGLDALFEHKRRR